MQIFVLGMHRSGTSVTARLLNMLGCYMGPERAALEHRIGRLTASNARGHWERADVMDINNAILKTIGARWDQPQTAPSLSFNALPDELKHALKLLVYGLDANRPWMVKDPRLCLTLPCWKPLVDVPVAVLVYRHPAQIASSLFKRNNIPLENGLALWETYITSALNHSLDMTRIFVNHESLMQQPLETVQQLHEQLKNAGVRRLEMPHEQEVLRFVNPSLTHIKQTEAMPDITLSANQQHLMQLMQGNLKQLATVSSV